MARFVSRDDLEFAIMRLRWEHKADLVSARDRVEQLLRSMPHEKLAALHAGLNKAVVTVVPLAKRTASVNRLRSHSRKAARTLSVCCGWRLGSARER